MRNILLGCAFLLACGERFNSIGELVGGGAGHAPDSQVSRDAGAIEAGGGGATLTCDNGSHACGGQCVVESPTHCGPSCTSCRAPENARATCAQGACDFECQAGYANCGGHCCFVRNDKVILLGGEEIGGVQSGDADTWAWDGSTWSMWPARAFGDAPWRSDHAMATLGTRVVLFAGADTAYKAWIGDTWEWDGAAWSRLTFGGPPARSSHAMTTFGAKIVLFGGDVSRRHFGDTWEWDGFRWTERSVSGPSARADHAMAVLGTKVVLFGGRDDSGFHADTWEWDGSQWTERSVSGPSARAHHVMAVLGAKVVLFGGWDVSGPLGDTWEWDGFQWTERSVSGPPARGFHAMAPTLGTRLVMFGGHDGTGVRGDTWEWDGSQWMQRNVAGPAARRSHAMATQ